MRKLLLTIALFVAVAVASGSSLSAAYNWSGTATGWYHETLDVYFDPNGIGTTISGTLDISNLSVGGAEMFGLIDKRLRDQDGYMWQSGAYVYVTKRADGTTRLGLSDGNLSGAIVSGIAGTYRTIATPYPDIVDFVFHVQGGAMTLDSSLLTETLNWNYGNIKTLNNAYGYPWNEFEDGAYLGGSLWPSSDSILFDVTATNPLPEPMSMALVGLGLSAVAGLRKRARKA